MSTDMVPLYKLERAKRIHRRIKTVGKIANPTFKILGTLAAIFLVGVLVWQAWLAGFGFLVLGVGSLIISIAIYGVYSTYVLDIIEQANENGVIDE